MADVAQTLLPPGRTVREPAVSKDNDAALGMVAAEAIVRDGLKAAYEERRSLVFARAAVSRFRETFAAHGLVRDMVEGAKQGAEALNVETYHGVVEVIQNAEDQGAREVRLAVAGTEGALKLLLVHDGQPVRFDHLVAMSYAFLSTKRDDAHATGRFGVGLKTLSRIATDLEIHCTPYHVDVETAGPRSIKAAADIAGFYSRTRGETLLRMSLVPGFSWDEFREWFESLGSDLLLFLDKVASVRLFDLRGRRLKSAGAYRVTRSRAVTVQLPRANGQIAASRVIVRDAAGNSWTRVTSWAPVPRDLRRSNKATGPTTPIGIAVPDRPGQQRLFAGLPLRVEVALPLSVNAQFDPDTARVTLQQRPWNSWLLKRAAELIGAAARDQAIQFPALSWRWIPLAAEARVAGQPWLSGELESLVARIQADLSRHLEIALPTGRSRLSKTTYEDAPLAALVSEADLSRLRPERLPLARETRDAGRWRAVVDELGVADRVGVAEALDMFEWDERRPAEWYAGLAGAALDAGVALGPRRSILLASGDATSPPTTRSGRVLVLEAVASHVATALGLAEVVDPIYASADGPGRRVRDWLERQGVLKVTASSRDALASLARRSEPLELDDDQVSALRDAFAELRPEERRSMGEAIGRVVRVDGYQFVSDASAKGGHRRDRLKVAPAAAYLPATIDAGGKDTWPSAAAAVGGLKWIDGRYKTALATKDDRPGARALFSVLGAAAAPRLVPRQDSDLSRDGIPGFRRLNNAGRLQGDAVQRLDYYPSHVLDERTSPDLDAVVADIVSLPVRQRRKRADALLTTIAEHWRNDYAEYATVRAVYSQYGWKGRQPVPAAWLSRLASQPWLSDRAGNARAPIDLAVPTPRALEVFGDDPSVYGAELPVVAARYPHVLEAMGVTVDPAVSQIVEALKDLRAQFPRPDATTRERAAGLYDALADYCVQLEHPVRPSSSVGDLKVVELRGAFGIGKERRGLIVAGGTWQTPQVVFRGRPIFGRRRFFVPERKRADGLWDVLNVRHPEIRDCTAVLEEIGAQPLDPSETATLIDVYRHLSTLGASSSEERDALVRVPLWGGGDWLRRRPIFAVDDPSLAAVLAERLPVWQSPVPRTTLGTLPVGLGVTSLDPTRFAAAGINDAAIEAGLGVVPRFRDAIAHLRDRLLRRDPAVFEALRAGWPALESSWLAITPDLAVEVAIEGRAPFTVATRAHVHASPDGLIVAVASLDDVGSEDAGGRAIASLFGGIDGSTVDRDKVALIWQVAWEASADGPPDDPLTVASSADASEIDPLSGLERDLRSAPARWRRSPKVRKDAAPAPAQPEPAAAPASVPQAPVAMRQLKRLDELVVGGIEVKAGRARKQRRRGPGSPLASPPPGVGGQAPAGRSLPRAYTEGEREALAVDVLRRLLETDKRALRDLRAVARLGADVVDSLGTYFEIKSAAGEMPDVIDLQASELRRALERPRDAWFLVVVAGLEEGYETLVRFIADPLRHLQWVERGAVGFTGVRSAKAIEIRLGEQVPDAGGEAH